MVAMKYRNQSCGSKCRAKVGTIRHDVTLFFLGGGEGSEGLGFGPFPSARIFSSPVI